MNLHQDSLWIGRLLKKTLESVVAVYPCVASTGAPDEYCVYRRVGYEGRNTKDRFNYEERLSLQLSVASQSYERGLEIAQQIKERLDGKRMIWEGKPVDSVAMVGASEHFSEPEYIQTLLFEIKIDTTNGK